MNLYLSILGLWYFTCWNCWIHSELYPGVQFCLTLFHFTFREVCRFWTSFWRKLGWRVASRIMGHWKLCSIEETQTVVDTEVFLWRIPVVEFSLLARKVKLSLGWKCWERFEWNILGLIICGLDPRWPLRQRPSCLEVFYVFLHVLWLLRLAVAS